jgi:hypothetical protein
LATCLSTFYGIPNHSAASQPKTPARTRRRAEALAFLDDDDLYARAYLERATALLFSHAHGQQIAPDLLALGPALVDALLLTVPMAFQRTVVRAGAFKRIGDYTEHCILWDCDWALRAALDGPTLLNQTPLYRQRAAGQGFFSQAETTLRHLRSSIEIRERLGTGFNGDVTLHPHLHAAFRRSSALAYFNLAYYLQAHGQSRAALRAWLDSQKCSPNLRRCKFPLRVIMGAFKQLAVARNTD